VCFPLKIVVVKDNLLLYDMSFTDFFEFFHHAKSVSGWKTLKFSSTQDLSSQWKCLKKGGACKIKTFVCHVRVTRSEQCIYANDTPCAQLCQPIGQSNCFHHDFCCGTMEDKQDMIWKRSLSVMCIMQATVTSLPGSTIQCKLEQADATNDAGHILFKPITTAEKTSFQNYLMMS